ncbi:uncharacterized protein LOC116213655 [Punica granatum]|uniref:Uncharacterized protein LOC116213655 n=1 Tax=Punica granatum TaxID=22663 RepID=A0A6P8E3L8_PUNGR|nr:uncharacterized protein LOC116213655 [Punica granatum]
MASKKNSGPPNDINEPRGKAQWDTRTTEINNRDVVATMAIDIVSPPDPHFRGVPLEIKNDSGYWAHFKNCFRAMEGTHVKASIPPALQYLILDRKEYRSSNEIDEASVNVADQEMFYPVEFLNTLNLSGIPNNCLQLKEGMSVMLLRNINSALGMCNRTRLIITQLGAWIIEAKIITGTNVGAKVLILRIVLTAKNSKWPFVP